MSNQTMTWYTVEVDINDREVIVTDVYAANLNDALAQAYTECDSAYVEVYGPSVADWMQVRLVNTDTGESTDWYTLDALGEVEA